MSPLGADHAAQRAQHGRLAGAVGAEQRAHAARRRARSRPRTAPAPRHRTRRDRSTSSIIARLPACSALRPGPEIGLDHGRVLLHLGRRALGDLAAEIERDDPVGHRHDEVHVMLDEQHGRRGARRGCAGSARPARRPRSCVSPPAGSSSNSSAGRAASARASSTRLRVPSGSPAAGRSATSRRSSMSSSAQAVSVSAASRRRVAGSRSASVRKSPRPRACPPIRTLSRTLCGPNSARF